MKTSLDIPEEARPVGFSSVKKKKKKKKKKKRKRKNIS